MRNPPTQRSKTLKFLGRYLTVQYPKIGKVVEPDLDLTLEVKASTCLKPLPHESSKLSKDSVFWVKPGQSFELESAKRDRASHWQLRFPYPVGESGKQRRVWYAYQAHVDIAGLKGDRPPSVKLSVPYKCQTDNQENPYGSCNVTSIAMCLEYLGTSRKPEYSCYTQFEDELYNYAIDNCLDRHSPVDLAKIVTDYGFRDRFSPCATISEVQEHLAGAHPAVTHGYFTPSGHIVTLVGYDETGFLVHDPYGEWWESGYDTEAPGAYLHYSYHMIEHLCIPDGNFWVHFISK